MMLVYRKANKRSIYLYVVKMCIFTVVIMSECKDQHKIKDWSFTFILIWCSFEFSFSAETWKLWSEKLAQISNLMEFKTGKFICRSKVTLDNISPRTFTNSKATDECTRILLAWLKREEGYCEAQLTKLSTQKVTLYIILYKVPLKRYFFLLIRSGAH